MQERQNYRYLYNSMLEAFTKVNLAYCLIEPIFDANDKAVDLRYIEINSAVEFIFGQKRQEIIGKTRKELFGNTQATEDIIMETYGRIVQTGKPAHFQSLDSTVGRYYDTYAWKVDERIAVISIDVTEHKKANEALKYQAAIIDIVNDAVVATDERFIITLWNNCAENMYGWTAQEAIGKPANDLLKTEFITENALWTFQQLLLNGFVHQEVIHTKKDGSKIVVDAMLSAIKDPNGKVIQAVAVFRDITERKHSEEALKQRTEQLEKSQKKLRENAKQLEAYANQMEQLAEQRAKQLRDKERLVTIGETAGMVGHDIRNPLQAIVNELYLARDALARVPQTPEKQDMLGSLTFIQEQVDYVNKIVADLQDYARDTKPTLSQVNVEELVNTTFSVLAVPKNVEVKCHIDEDLEIITDSAYLRRILTNLSNNAIQAMPQGGKITITATPYDDYIELTVSDTGIGIPDEVKDNLFKPLFTTKARGQGFGLAVVKKFVEQLDGQITFDSKPGSGTSFFIRLPKNNLPLNGTVYSQ